MIMLMVEVKLLYIQLIKPSLPPLSYNVVVLAGQRNVWIFTNSDRKCGNKRLLRKIVNTGGVTGGCDRGGCNSANFIFGTTYSSILYIIL